MRGLKKTALDGTYRMTDRHTDGHGDSMTNSAQRAELVKSRILTRGQFLVSQMIPKQKTVNEIVAHRASLGWLESAQICIRNSFAFVTGNK